MKVIDVTDMKDFNFGHDQNDKAGTGCTVILAKEGATAGVNVRGGAPGTRETDLLKSENLVQKIHGLFLAGGSAFGLQAGSGVMDTLEKQGIGFDTPAAKVPIVPGAILYDLNVGSSTIRPDNGMGRRACENALLNKPFLAGNYGAGTGATVGKVLGNEQSMKGGIGTYAVQIHDLQVGAVVAVNCFGDVINPYNRERIAGVYNRKKRVFLHTEDLLLEQVLHPSTNRFSENTSIGAVVTNAVLSKPEANKMAALAHDGFARTMMPAHTFVDGDTIFTMSSGKVKVDLNSLSYLYAYVVEQAVLQAVYAAKSCYGIVANRDLKLE
ncbi:peptidase [Halobacillus andaensis]|uniref:Peptidase n=1 Tax=Halobacillus andaensis TaxID=1176239 RepID=A0A917EV53_HALAA|nr:P1 family peptidase [Halobacillus andaensis]MBP2003345.1 L-aminopeptidase/D-esterase-like protein [Halobacillus andaensis]GGF09940.1 peptidase [Halobacillus andaensis]